MKLTEHKKVLYDDSVAELVHDMKQYLNFKVECKFYFR